MVYPTYRVSSVELSRHITPAEPSTPPGRIASSPTPFSSRFMDSSIFQGLSRYSIDQDQFADFSGAYSSGSFHYSHTSILSSIAQVSEIGSSRPGSPTRPQTHTNNGSTPPSGTPSSTPTPIHLVGNPPPIDRLLSGRAYHETNYMHKPTNAERLVS